MFPGDPLHEPFPGSGLEVEGPRSDAGGARRSQGAEQGIEGLVAVREPGQDGHGHHSAGQPRFPKPCDQLEACTRTGCAGLHGFGEALVRHRQRDAHPDGHLGGGVFQERDVPGQQRALGQDRQGSAGIGQGPDDARHELVAALGPLVGVRVGAQGHVLPPPGGLGQFPAQDLRGVDLHHHLAVKVQPGVEVEVGVALPGEAVDAGVAAAAVRVDGPLERHPRTGDHFVEHRFGGDLVESDPGKLGGGHGTHQPDQGQQGIGGGGLAAPARCSGCPAAGCPVPGALSSGRRFECLCVPSHGSIRMYVRV